MKKMMAVVLFVAVMGASGCWLDTLIGTGGDAADRSYTKADLIGEERQEDGSWK
ncbi:MAG: hypothetical protein MUC33_01325 [Desulfobacterales bacterium]|jgi:hypothetical protein|nr:hypothetical protein [Desulfobacterales bacterium]MCU0601284.1 hypothetical protein [Desulfobacterales bacterium]